MPYKAVCEELWSIRSDAPSRMLYRETPMEAGGCASNRMSLGAACDEMRRVNDKNNNSRLRSDAQTHMGSLTHVPAGISLSVGHTRYPPTLRRNGSAARAVVRLRVSSERV
jgi:hypothetical protein